MSRRRRRHHHADPATLPRRDAPDHQQKQRREDRDRAARQLVRVDDALGRATAVMAAAIVYFGSWAINSIVGLFPPPLGLDLSNPQFIIGAAALVGSLFLGRWLAQRFETKRLIGIARWSASVFGLVVVAFIALLLALAPTSEAVSVIVFGMGLSWVLATVWVGVLARRAARLLGAVGEAG